MIGIVGYGVVGKALHRDIIAKNFPDKKDVIWYDKFNHSNYVLKDLAEQCTIIFLCLPTPTKNGEQDATATIDTLSKLKGFNGLIVIKSTVLPKKVEEIINKFKDLDIMTNPEFLDQATPYDSNSKNIIGVQNMYQAERYFERTGLDFDIITNPETAMMIKYVHNVHGAVKIALFNEFYRICNDNNIDYRTVTSSLLKINDNVGAQYTKIATDGKPGFGGACFPKDIVAFDNMSPSPILEAAIELNKKLRQKEMLYVLE